MLRARILLATLMLFALLAITLSIPLSRAPASSVTAQVCRSKLANTVFDSGLPFENRSLIDYAHGVSVAILVVETSNRPAFWRLFEEIMYNAAAHLSPRLRRMSVGPAQISSDFFDRHIKPIAPDSVFPDAVMTLAGARETLTIWATAQLTVNHPNFSDALTGEQQEILAGLFDTFHGARDETYRAAALHVVSGRCLSDAKYRNRMNH
ncbi:MAG: hypothetical protein ACK52I_13855 [Pseudomonadota bacterium]|jgi:hypothetical protein